MRLLCDMYAKHSTLLITCIMYMTFMYITVHTHRHIKVLAGETEKTVNQARRENKESLREV